MADQHPYRNVRTGVVQLLTEEQAAVFPGRFDLLADDYETREAEAAEAQAALDAAKASGAPKSEVKDAQAAVVDAQKAADAAVVTPAAETETPKES